SHLSRRKGEGIQLGWLRRRCPVLQEAHIAGGPDRRLDDRQVSRQCQEVDLMAHYALCSSHVPHSADIVARYQSRVSLPCRSERSVHLVSTAYRPVGRFSISSRAACAATGCQASECAAADKRTAVTGSSMSPLMAWRPASDSRSRL